MSPSRRERSEVRSRGFSRPETFRLSRSAKSWTRSGNIPPRDPPPFRESPDKIGSGSIPYNEKVWTANL